MRSNPEGADACHPVSGLAASLTAVPSGGMVSNPKMLSFLNDRQLARESWPT